MKVAWKINNSAQIFTKNFSYIQSLRSTIYPVLLNININGNDNIAKLLKPLSQTPS